MFALTFYVLADMLVWVLPARVANALSVVAARAAFLVGLPQRAALESNLQQLLRTSSGRSVREKARESFVNFALMFTDFLRMGHLDRAQLAEAVEVHGGEHLERARASGRGVILLSAHLGNWELGAAWLAARGTQVNVVARPHSSRVERFFAARRRAWGVRMLPGRPLWRAAATALRRREWVAVMADRLPAADAPARGSACAWASALSRRTGALVLPAVIVRRAGGRYAAYFECPIDPEDMRAERPVTILRRWLRRFPGQWFAFEPLPDGIT